MQSRWNPTNHKKQSGRKAMSLYYEDETVRLFHGNCLDETEWTNADVLVTDPPYGMDWVPGNSAYHNGVVPKKADLEMIRNDDSVTVRDEMLKLWGKRPAIVFGNWRQPRPPNVKTMLIWHKKGKGPMFLGGNDNIAWYPVFEEIYILGSGFRGPAVPNVYTTNEPRHMQPKIHGHPTPKPVTLMQDLITRCPDGVIAEPFAGSGATILAARLMGRKVIACEIEEKYCELIAKKMAQQLLF
jgi:site-specific DNA-methyltransferase (adenine-specific)